MNFNAMLGGVLVIALGAMPLVLAFHYAGLLLWIWVRGGKKENKLEGFSRAAALGKPWLITSPKLKETNIGLFHLIDLSDGISGGVEKGFATLFATVSYALGFVVINTFLLAVVKILPSTDFTQAFDASNLATILFDIVAAILRLLSQVIEYVGDLIRSSISG